MEQLLSEHLAVWTEAQVAKAAGGRGRGKKGGELQPYGIKKLRELILELAVRGKLVPQDPADEPAAVLLERIAAEKAHLVKEGRIKRQKKLPEITEEEKPFGLPEGWEWVRLGNLAEFINGYAFKSRDFIDDGVGVVRIGDIQDGEILTSKMVRVHQEIVQDLDESLIVKRNDLVIAMSGATTGKLGFNKRNEDFYINQRVGKISPLNISVEFLYYPLTTKVAENLEKSMGSAIPNLSTVQVKNIVIALPPLSEQHRIVPKVDELMALCDRLEEQQSDSTATRQALVTTLLDALTNSADHADFAASWQRIAEHFDLLFTTEQSIDQLKQTILQLAVMGKLVPQNPEDEPAAVLLEKIAEEKARLIKEGNIKRQKKLPEITEEEKPFALPEGWEWVRFDNVMDITSGVTKGRKLAGRALVSVPYLRVANVQRGFLDLDIVKEIEIPRDELEKFSVIERDLLITEGGDWDKVGRTARWNGELPYVAHQNHIFKARCILLEQNELWFEKYLNSSWAREYFASSSKQTTNLASINKTQLRGTIVAIPPLPEQHRIVAKVDELLTLCDTLKSHLHQARTTQVQLADALVAQVME